MPGLKDGGSTTHIPVNPLDSGNDPHSIDASAADFDRMLSQEIPPKGSGQGSEAGQRAPRRADPPKGRAAGPSGDAPSPETEGEPPADEFLDAQPKPPKPQDAPDEDDEDEGEGEGEGEDEEAELDEEEIDQEALLDKEFEVSVNGKTENLPLREILDGYSRDADYRQKTARLADERKEVETFAEEVVSQRQRYDAKLAEFEDLVKTFRPSEADWQALKGSNLPLYIETKEQWDKLDRKLAEAYAERQQLGQEANTQATRNYNAYVREQNDKLFEAVPALRNDGKAKEFRGKLFKYGQRFGYTPEELARGLVDHRDILVMYRAAKYQEILDARKANGKGKGKRRPGGPTPSSSPRSVSRLEGHGPKIRKAEERHARTGTVGSAADAFTALIESGRI